MVRKYYFIVLHPSFDLNFMSFRLSERLGRTISIRILAVAFVYFLPGRKLYRVQIAGVDLKVTVHFLIVYKIFL